MWFRALPRANSNSSQTLLRLSQKVKLTRAHVSPSRGRGGAAWRGVARRGAGRNGAGRGQTRMVSASLCPEEDLNSPQIWVKADTCVSGWCCKTSKRASSKHSPGAPCRTTSLLAPEAGESVLASSQALYSDGLVDVSLVGFQSYTVLGACPSGAGFKSPRCSMWGSRPFLLRKKFEVLTVSHCQGWGLRLDCVPASPTRFHLGLLSSPHM